MKIWERHRHIERRPPTAVERAYKAQYYFQEYTPDIPSELDLALISLREHRDVAAQTLFQCLVKSDQFGPWIQRVHRDWKSETLEEPTRFQVFVAHCPLPVYEPVSVAWARSVIQTLEGLGVEVHQLALDARETLSTNARVLRATLEAHMNRTSLLLTMGRSTLEMVRYLEALKGDFSELEALKAWISLSGSYKGMELYRKKMKTPLLKWRLKGRTFLERQPSESLLELSTEFPVWKSADYPGKLPFEVLSMFGVPRSEALHPQLRSTFRALSDHGPSDGLNTLSQCLPPFTGANIYPLWGEDFFLRGSGFHHSLRRILCGLLGSR